MSDRQIECIEIGFENCEVFKVPVSSIDTLIMNDIMEQIYVQNNNVFKHKTAEEVFLILEKLENVKPLESYSDTFVKRALFSQDITSISLIYTCGTEEDIYVLWDDDTSNCNVNKLQQNLILPDGKFQITIKRSNADNV